MIENFKKLPTWLRLLFLFPLLFLNGFLLSFLVNYLQPLISFIIIASILAFILELLVKLLIEKGIKRELAITIVLVSGLILVTIVNLILIPLIVQQLGSLITIAPQWIQDTNEQLEALSNDPIFKRLSLDTKTILVDINQEIANTLKSLGGKILEIIAGTITSLLYITLILVLSIFLLIGGDKFWQGIFSYFPEPWNEKIPKYTQKTFKDYFLARLTLTAISSTARWVLLLLFGVPYSALFGFGFGIVGFIPFVGAILGLIGLIILGFNSFADGVKFFLISFVVDQINDNVLSPRIMGNAIGLNPVWLIISLFIGAKIGGMLGIFLAVPVASIIKQIIDDLRQVNSDNLTTVLPNEEISE